MKILQVTRQFLPCVGGIENSVYGLSQCLNTRGYSTDVLTLNRKFKSGEILPSFSNIEGIKVYRIPYWGLSRYPIAPSVLHFLRSYDVIHIHGIDFFIDFLSFTKFLHRKPLVVTTHGGIFHTQWLTSLKRLYFNTISRLSMSAADAVVCVSAHDYAMVKAPIASSKFQVIYNGVSIEPFLNTEKSIDRELLIGIGRIFPNKRIEKIIELLPELSRSFPEVRLLWIGPDPHKQVASLANYAEQLGVAQRVQFLGYVSDLELKSYLAKAHLFVSASSYEAFGISTIEAMSSATVSVVTPVGVHPEVIIPGETGFICDFEDKDETLEYIQKILTMDDSQLYSIGQRARIASAKFSWHEITDAHLSVYQSICF